MADAHDIPYKPHSQCENQLCWAATTQVVVDTLHQPTDQASIAALAWFPATDVINYPNKVATCKGNMEACNVAHAPVLDQLGFGCSLGSALSKHHLTQKLIRADINNDLPILFGWHYSNSYHEDNGSHFMVIVGYLKDADRKFHLRIYDPLPVRIGNEQLIRYDNYTVETGLELHVDMGLPYGLAETYYKISHGSMALPALAPLPNVPTVPVLQPAAPAPSETQWMDPRKAIEASRPAALAEVARRRARDGTPLSAGDPLPIIALGLKDLRETDRPSVLGLLRRGTTTVLYPVVSGDRVRDSFLMIKRDDEWVEGGYANTTVARLLVEQRNRLALTPAQRAGQYLLSVPALGGFFLASGTGAAATLMAVNDDRSIRLGERSVQANRPYRADELMPALADAASRARPAPYPERGAR